MTINYFSTNVYISFHILVYIKIHKAEEDNNESNFWNEMGKVFSYNLIDQIIILVFVHFSLFQFHFFLHLYWGIVFIYLKVLISSF